MVSHGRSTSLLTAALLVSAWFTLALAADGQAGAPPETPPPRPNALQASPNKLIVENRSGDPVHCELIGPSAQVIELADGQDRTVNVAPGEYTMQVRYGTDPTKYSYSKVAPFKIEQTATTYMAATITIDCLAERFSEPVP